MSTKTTEDGLTHVHKGRGDHRVIKGQVGARTEPKFEHGDISLWRFSEGQRYSLFLSMMQQETEEPQPEVTAIEVSVVTEGGDVIVPDALHWSYTDAGWLTVVAPNGLKGRVQHTFPPGKWDRVEVHTTYKEDLP